MVTSPTNKEALSDQPSLAHSKQHEMAAWVEDPCRSRHCKRPLTKTDITYRVSNLMKNQMAARSFLFFFAGGRFIVSCFSCSERAVFFFGFFKGCLDLFLGLKMLKSLRVLR